MEFSEILLCVDLFHLILLVSEAVFSVLGNFLVFLYFLPSSRTSAVMSSPVTLSLPVYTYYFSKVAEGLRR